MGFEMDVHRASSLKSRKLHLSGYSAAWCRTCLGAVRPSPSLLVHLHFSKFSTTWGSDFRSKATPNGLNDPGSVTVLPRSLHSFEFNHPFLLPPKCGDRKSTRLNSSH